MKMIAILLTKPDLFSWKQGVQMIFMLFFPAVYPESRSGITWWNSLNIAKSILFYRNFPDWAWSRALLPLLLQAAMFQSERKLMAIFYLMSQSDTSEASPLFKAFCLKLFYRADLFRI